MIQFEYFPQVVEAHRNDLRALAQPLPIEVTVHPWRRAIGIRLVQLGRWIEGNRPDIVGEIPARLGTPTGTA